LMKEQGGEGLRSRVIGCKIMCVVCNRYFSAENASSELSEHQEREHFEFWREKNEFLKEKFKDRTCTICDKRFNTPGDYKTHMFVHNPDGQRKFSCEVCGKSVNEARTFKRHMMIHNNEFTCRCKVCDKGFIRYDKMMDHVKRVHSEYYTGQITGQITGQLTSQITGKFTGQNTGQIN